MKLLSAFRWLGFTTILTIIVLLTSCKKEEPIQQKTYKNVVLSDHTYFPEELKNFSKVQVDSNKLVLTFINSTNLPSYRVGDILIGTENVGYLRKVESVSVQGNSILVSTTNAALNEAFDEIKIDTSFTFSPADKSLDPIDYKESILINGESYDYSVKSSQASMTVDESTKQIYFTFPNMSFKIQKISGSDIDMVEIKVEKIEVGLTIGLEEFLLDINLFRPSNVSIVFKVENYTKYSNASITARGGVVGQFPDIGKEDLFKVDKPLGVLTICPGVSFFFNFNIAAGIQAKITANLGIDLYSTTYSTHSYLVGARLINGTWNGVWETEAENTTNIDFSPKVGVSGDVRLFLKPKLKIKLDDVTGPSLYIRGFVYVETKYPPIDAAWGFGLNGGLEYNLKIFHKEIVSYNWTFFEKKWPLWSLINYAPKTPTIVYPPNNSEYNPTTLNLSWDCKDPDNDPLTFNIFFGTTDPPTVLASSEQKSTVLTRSGLLNGTKYYWKVVAKDNHENSTDSPIWSFTTGKAPLAAFIASPITITEGQSVQFTDESTNTPTSWSWDFGDGGTSTFQSPSHNYATAGTYTVTLTATNSFGSDGETKTNYIRVNSESSGIIFNPNLTYGSVTDIDRNVYKTIQIGTQIWMAENLKTTKYNDGLYIPLETNNTSWSNLTTPGYCWYGNDTSNKATYGALYNWYTVNTGKLCPTGWHAPTKDDWNTLLTYVNDNGGKLKETGTTHWDSPNGGATNESGFTALPGGFRYSGIYYNIRAVGSWWSATDFSFNAAGTIYLGAQSFGYGNQNDSKNFGHSIRCIKD